ncbi:S-adenosylmethionine:tRNA ribosyltransferase-isomerase [Streptomyces sp. NPDC058525]|uniref:S-adenosylmethionine:tRNA ribosyltransferase-isomerase n=1 Tax=unclassified Streptomyces TaxID=2593676 RepID=UPI003664376C
MPPSLAARVPAEQRGPGLGRDSVRLLVSRGSTEVSLRPFRELPGLLRAGDVLVVNTSATLPAAVDGRLGREDVVVHFSTRGDDGRWSVELRTPAGGGTTRPHAGGPAGAVVELPGGHALVLEEPLSAGADRLWWARPVERELPPVGAAGRPEGGPGVQQAYGAGAAGRSGGGTPGPLREDGPGAAGRSGGGVAGPLREDGPGAAGRSGGGVAGPLREDGPGAGGRPEGVPGLLGAYGRPIRYAYTERDQPLAAYQTVFAVPAADGSGSAEMPSAARPFTAELVARLVSRGVQFAPLTLHTGVASQEAHEPPYPERYEVPAATAWLVNAARAAGGRVIAVGTTAVRALESAADARGRVRAARGWTDLVVTPERGVRAVDGLLTGLHEPEASHLLMLEAVAGRAAVRLGYAEAAARLCLWHEFGDVHLLLRNETGH